MIKDRNMIEGKARSVVKKQGADTKPSAPPAPRKEKMDEKTASEMIEKIGSWLADGAPGATKKRVYETVSADLAREFARRLLEDARADGHGGCELCQG